MKIHVLTSIGNVQASPHPPKPSNPPQINEKPQQTIRIHVLESIGLPLTLPSPQILVKSKVVQENQGKGMSWHQLAMSTPPPHAPYFSKALGTVPNAMYDGNQHAKQEVRGTGGAYKSGRWLEGRAHQACRIPIEGLRYEYTRALFL